MSAKRTQYLLFIIYSLLSIILRIGTPDTGRRGRRPLQYIKIYRSPPFAFYSLPLMYKGRWVCKANSEGIRLSIKPFGFYSIGHFR